MPATKPKWPLGTPIQYVICSADKRHRVEPTLWVGATDADIAGLTCPACGAQTQLKNSIMYPRVTLDEMVVRGTYQVVDTDGKEAPFYGHPFRVTRIHDDSNCCEPTQDVCVHGHFADDDPKLGVVLCYPGNKFRRDRYRVNHLAHAPAETT